MPSDRLRELKQQLDHLVVQPEFFDDEPTPDEQRVLDEAIANFLAAGPEILDDATGPLWQYYSAVAGQFSPTERETYGIPEIPPTTDIWREVTISSPPGLRVGRDPHNPAPSYISFEGEVTWEPEHGLQIVFERGLRVCKVGPYDGHDTNAAAWNDLTLLDVVFKA